jgi:hypothetical protein
VAALAGLVVIFFTVPGRVAWSDSAFIVSVLALVAGTVVLAWAITSHVRRQLRGEADDLQSLVMLLALVLVVFSFGFFGLEQTDPGQVSGLQTRIDAFYFTLATMSTVGYGDVHAAGQVARALVATQMIFNIIFVGALAAVLTGRVRIRAQERELARRGSPTGGDVPPTGAVPPSASPPSRTSGREVVPITDSAPTARTLALARIASLVALDAPAASYVVPVRSAVGEGVTGEELHRILQALAPEVGATKVAAATSHVGTALGRSLGAPEPDAETRRPEPPPLPRRPT